MNNWLVFITYFAAASLAMYLVWHFRRIAWYWHVAAIVVAVAIGVMPPLANWQGQGYDLTVGASFVFLFVWGAGFVIERLAHHAWSRASGKREKHA